MESCSDAASHGRFLLVTMEFESGRSGNCRKERRNVPSNP